MDKMLLRKAIGRASNKLVRFNESGIFSYIYPFTTENINGYIDIFDLKDKNILTVGSSGDQVINIAIKGAKNQTVVDICPFTKYYFYLKKAGLITLNYDNFSSYFCYLDYPKVFKTNQKAFNISSWNNIFPMLKELDYESFQFWNELFNIVNPLDVRLNLFSHDEDRFDVLKNANLYLKDEIVFKKTKRIIEEIEPKFVIGDIFNLEIEKVYDNIFLSNLAQYYSLEKYKQLLDKLDSNLSEEGKMLVSYLYRTEKNKLNDENERGIYNLKKAEEILGKYITRIEDFTGVLGLKFQEPELKDSVMIYQKSNNKKYIL